MQPFPLRVVGQLSGPARVRRSPECSVCLITPPSPFLLDERVFMTLGILRVATALFEAGYTVEMVDTSGIANYSVAVHDHVLSSRARAFGITATTPQLPAAMAIMRTIRRARPDARIILGGPHVTLVNAAARRERRLGLDGRASRALRDLFAAFDVLVAGDGERAIFDALADDPPAL